MFTYCLDTIYVLLNNILRFIWKYTFWNYKPEVIVRIYKVLMIKFVRRYILFIFYFFHSFSFLHSIFRYQEERERKEKYYQTKTTTQPIVYIFLSFYIIPFYKVEKSDDRFYQRSWKPELQISIKYINQKSRVAKVVGICIDYDQTKWSEDKNAISRSDRQLWL